MDQTEYILFQEMYSGRASSHVGPYKRKEYILCQEICCGRESSPVGAAESKGCSALLPSYHHPGKGPALEYPNRGVSYGPDRVHPVSRGVFWKSVESCRTIQEKRIHLVSRDLLWKRIESCRSSGE
ncbi:uncharacterized protein LOC118477785 [Aplysia californica]|uniref:Uncharacterized protein LOC118477785 n=1 Tax=Aplysia californica TaxID=6500 RepID=A0ABM1VUA0_APLCA|nr:uncharacterized protein LOC118477785 [Aplysia californica]